MTIKKKQLKLLQTAEKIAFESARKSTLDERYGREGLRFRGAHPKGFVQEVHMNNPGAKVTSFEITMWM